MNGFFATDAARARAGTAHYLRGTLRFSAWRFWALIFFIACAMTGLIARMIDLAVIHDDFLRHQGDVRALRTIQLPAYRGMIVDRNGNPLAVSAPVAAIWIDPAKFHPTKQQEKILQSLLPFVALHPTSHAKHFAWLSRHVVPEIAQQIQQLHIQGLFIQQTFHRFYPEGEVAAHLTGFTNVDDQGQEGLELTYNGWLAGQAGKKEVIQDAGHHVVSDVKVLHEREQGHDLVLSIDRRLQLLAFQALTAGIKENLAVSGSVVILDVHTGEILAMVNIPSFNPNQLNARLFKNKKNNFRNRAVTDSFEPGSTIKTFSIAAALESKKYQPDSLIDTWPGFMRVGHHVVRDEHNNNLLSLTQVLERSSNVGISKVILSLPPERLPDILRRVGFGEVTSVHFPGEQSGKLPANPVSFPLATLAFGYGLSVTPLQLAAAYAIFANDGVKVPVTLLHRNKPPVGQRIFSSELAHTMLAMLHSVVIAKGATGFAAKISGYQVAGKTGTAWIAGRHGYAGKQHHYTSTFVGIAPVSEPRLVVAVVIRDPQGKRYFGSDVSAPVFAKIMEPALQLLAVPRESDSQKRVDRQ